MKSLCAFTEVMNEGKSQQIQGWLEKRFSYHSFFSEVYSNCSDELGVKLAIRVLVEEARFTHARVTKG